MSPDLGSKNSIRIASGIADRIHAPIAHDTSKTQFATDDRAAHSLTFGPSASAEKRLCLCAHVRLLVRGTLAVKRLGWFLGLPYLDLQFVRPAEMLRANSQQPWPHPCVVHA